ncbi:hypothetical protein [Pectobacterium versatile]|uniref:hypothetical protein n=1 Tax=Enterobacterales TaxID=91347 RepID=UPI000D606E02|nr:hypothetical protein [Pectobacterium versatile]PWD71010.1 hypothetical protein DF215_08405 [Pectobacterium versatile]
MINLLKKEDFKYYVMECELKADGIVGSGFDEASEAELREALELYEKCFWFYIERRDEIFNIMHKIGHHLREKYGCAFDFCENRSQYYSKCPNHLIQFEFGFSLRAIEEPVCSICGKNPIECDHLTGEIYDGVEAKTYNRLVDIITADRVKEPEMPFARIRERLFPRESIVKGLSQDPIIGNLYYGKAVLNCDHCLVSQVRVSDETAIGFKLR